MVGEQNHNVENASAKMAATKRGYEPKTFECHAEALQADVATLIENNGGKCNSKGKRDALLTKLRHIAARLLTTTTATVKQEDYKIQRGLLSQVGASLWISGSLEAGSSCWQHDRDYDS